MKSIGQIISHYRKEAGLSQIALSKKLKDLGVEVSSKSISAWEHGRSEPSVETFLYICRILGIWDCIEVCFGSNPGDPLSVLNVDGKDMVISFIEMLRHSSQYLKPEHAPTNVSAALAPAATRHLRLYNVTASTGTGSFLDSDSYTTLESDVKKAGSADFAVTMSDDSMEPLFHSHEMVLVHQQDTLEAETSGSLRSTAASVSESSKATGAEFPWYRQPPSTVRSRSAPESTPSGSSGRCSRGSSAGAQAFFCTVPWRRTGTGTPAPFHSPVLIHRGQSWQETLLSPCGTQ